VDERFAVETGPEGDPVRVGLPGAMREVAEILDRWWGEGHRYVRLRTADGARYVVRHDDAAGGWSLIHFEA
jgi:hypothetical protein